MTYLLYGLAALGGLALFGVIAGLFEEKEDEYEEEEEEPRAPPDTVDDAIKRAVAREFDKRSVPQQQQTDPLIEMIWYDAFRRGGK